MNFIWNGQLADLQQSVFEQYLKGILPNEKTIKILNKNVMVKLAAILAPSNLVVRHYCLIDLISGKNKHNKKIEKQCYKISLFKKGQDLTKCLWSEGYSYWNYTNLILKKYVDIFRPDWAHFVNIMDINFKKTSFLNGDLWYPAPFGDVWESPLDRSLQQNVNCTSEKIGPVTKIDSSHYLIEEKPIGFNLHTKKLKMTYSIVAGIPVNIQSGKPFKYYKGYKEKFPNKIDEIKFMTSLSRLMYFLKP